MQEFLIEIQASQQVDCSALAAILVGRAREGDEATRLVAMRWLREFVSQAKEQLLQHYAPILAAVLPGLAHPNSEVAKVLSFLPDGSGYSAATSMWSSHCPDDRINGIMHTTLACLIYSPCSFHGTPRAMHATGTTGGQGSQSGAAAAAEELAVSRHRGCPGACERRAGQRAGADSAGSASLGQYAAGQGSSHSMPLHAFRTAAFGFFRPPHLTAVCTPHTFHTLTVSKARETCAHIISQRVMSSLSARHCLLLCLDDPAKRGWRLPGVQVLKRLDVLLPALLDALTAPSERVAIESLAVQASIAADEQHFQPLIQQLLSRCAGLQPSDAGTAGICWPMKGWCSFQAHMPGQAGLASTMLAAHNMGWHPNASVACRNVQVPVSNTNQAMWGVVASTEAGSHTSHLAAAVQ